MFSCPPVALRGARGAGAARAPGPAAPFVDPAPARLDAREAQKGGGAASMRRILWMSPSGTTARIHRRLGSALRCVSAPEAIPRALERHARARVPSEDWDGASQPSSRHMHIFGPERISERGAGVPLGYVRSKSNQVMISTPLPPPHRR